MFAGCSLVISRDLRSRLVSWENVFCHAANLETLLNQASSYYAKNVDSVNLQSFHQPKTSSSSSSSQDSKGLDFEQLATTLLRRKLSTFVSKPFGYVQVCLSLSLMCVCLLLLLLLIESLLCV
jgi:hypothetical protein